MKYDTKDGEINKVYPGVICNKLSEWDFERISTFYKSKLFSSVFPQIKHLWNVLCLEAQGQTGKMINQWEEIEKPYNKKMGYWNKIRENT